nr:PAS domain-containing sensor histidine kinase [Afifella sp. IM 167]
MSRIIVLSVGLVAAAGSYLFVPPQWAEAVVLICLGVLSAVGVMCLFLAAGGFIRFARAKAAASRAPALSEEIFEAIGEGAVICNRSAGPLRGNAAYLKLAGDGDVDLPSVERLFAESPDASEAIYRLASAAEKGRRAAEEIRMPGGVGGRSEGARWYRVKVNPIPAEPELVLWLISDITREREHQENIFQELQNAIDYLDHAPAGFFSMQPDGRIRYLNATLAEWLGIDLAEFEPGGSNISDFLTSESASLLEAASARGETGTEVLEVDLARANGTRKPVRLLHRVPVSADGRLGASRTLVLEVTAGEADAGQAAERRFIRFFNNTPMAIASVDREGMINLSNARFLKLFRGSDAGRRIELASVVDASGRAPLNAAVNAAISRRGDIAPVDAQFGENEERSARFFVSPILEGEPGEDAAIVYALETTEQRALEAQFAQSQKMQAVGQLAGGIAHDFNNVLTAIIGYSDLLLSNHRPSDPAFQDIMNIKQNANRAANLVRQLLAFSRRQTLQPRVIRLDELLSEIANLLDRLLGEKVELAVEHQPGLWPVKADVNQLEQVVVNLAVNARDAMPDGGKLTIKTSNMSEAESADFREDGFRPGEYVLIKISDTGTGMSPEVMEKMFEPFFSTKDIGKGTGLGLSTVYGIVKQTGGFIYVDSAPGKGSTFSVLLPRHEPEAAEEAEAKPKAEPTDLTGSAGILLVEDEEAVRAFAARALKARGYQVHEAASGREALDIMAESGEAIDLVVSDVVMPEMDGPTLLKELRRTNPELKIIFVSGYAEDAFARHLPDTENFHFLPKPFSLKDLAMAVKKALES